MEKAIVLRDTSNTIKVLDERIVLAIRSQDGELSYYRIEKEKKVQRLLLTHCKAKNLKYHDMVFIYNGVRIRSSKTVLELGMEDGDEIDAMVHQIGGGYTTTHIPNPIT